MPPTVEELRRVSFLADLPDETVERVARWFEERHAEPGDNLTPEGASGYTFFVILDGTATVVHGGRTVATLGPGDFFGEGALVGDTGRRNASVIAESPLRVGAMFGTEFRVLERELPEVATQVRETLAVRQAELAG